MTTSHSDPRDDVARRRRGRADDERVAILLVEDDVYLRRIVRSALEAPGYEVKETATAKAALDALGETPDLIVLDLGLPDMDGVRLCREIRRRSTAPIVVLTARHAVKEKVELFDEGADDYVTKPFDTAEFLARVKAQLRRSRLPPPSAPVDRFERDELTIDFEARVVSRGAEPIRLTPIEWELIRLFVANAGRTMTHRRLFTAVWGHRSDGDPQAYLRVHVANLRRKIERDPVRPTLIITEAGVGYRLALAP